MVKININWMKCLGNSPRIELQNQHNVNMCDGNDETWFDDEIPVTHVAVIDEDEFFIRYFGEDYDACGDY